MCVCEPVHTCACLCPSVCAPMLHVSEFISVHIGMCV